ncbi:MAG: chromosome segregation protein SMC, partial [Planctomycetota bacterium]
RQRRHETELRLKRCEQDVERLDDVMGELRSRVRSLKIQAGKAEKYVTAKEEWTRGRSRQLSHRLVGYDESLESLKPGIESLEERVEGLREERAACEVAIEEREQERSEVVAELGRVGDEAGRISGDLRALEERRSQLAMRIASWSASSEEERARAEARGAQLEARQQELAGLGEQIEAVRARTAAAEERAAGLQAQSRELGRTYKELRGEVQAQNDRVLERLHERTAAENKIVHLGEALPPARERLERVASRFTAAEAQVAEVEALATTAEADLTATAAHLDAADTALAVTTGALTEESQRLDAEREARAAQEVERAAIESRVAALLDRERELEDLSGGARRVLEAVDEGEGPCHADDLLGLVADHVRADVRLARAIDAVLGDRAQALVARDAHVARRIVDWCAQEEVGQVGVVIPPGVGAPDCPPPSDFALFARFGAGVEGRLGDLVQCDEAMRPLIHTLFCDVVVVSSLDIALDLVGREAGWRFVTPRGEVVDAAGLVGGYREIGQGFVGRRSSAVDLQARADALGREITAREEAIAATEARRAELRVELDERTHERDAAREAQAEADAALSAARARLSDLAAALEAHREERGKADTEVQRVERELEEAGEAKTLAASAFDAENDRLEQMEKARRELEAEREDLQREEQRAQVELTSATTESSGLEQRIVGLERLVGETRSEIERASGRAETYAKSATEGRDEVAGIAEEATALEGAKSGLEEALAGLREKERSGAQRISETRKDAEAVQGRLDETSEDLGQRRLEAQAADLARREILGRAAEELGASEEELRETFESLDEELAGEEELAALEKHVAAVRAELDRLGPVNLDAVHELEEVGGRLEHLESQAADLAEARRVLLDTIKTIDEESRRLFVETFEEVRANFQTIFRLLFGGGRADIRLEDDEDVLDAGVEIVARPPGRELLSIGLLSGGQRTMTALALLFAVFEARPSPFCVLDEVDAALDDANIDRFLGMLDRFRESTQFIVVTHNKGTMAASQALYGVTMQVKGVSRFVAVELDDIDEFAPESTGSSRPRESRDAADAEGGDPSRSSGPDPAVEPSNGTDESGEPIKEIQAHPAGGGTGDEAAEPADALPLDAAAD